MLPRPAADWVLTIPIAATAATASASTTASAMSELVAARASVRMSSLPNRHFTPLNNCEKASISNSLRNYRMRNGNSCSIYPVKK